MPGVEMRKGQISIFIMLGVILILMTGMLLYLQGKEVEPITVEIIEKPSVFPVDSYITFCLEQKSREAISLLASQGGKINISSENSFQTKLGSTTLHFIPEEGNSLVSIADAEEELSDMVENSLPDCIDITEYERLEYSVTAGDISVETSINRDDVFVELNYPIRLERPDEVIVEDYFSESVNLPLGQFMFLANDITNAELQGPINLDYFRLTYPDIYFVKEKPYPNSIYYMKTTVPEGTSSYLSFVFAVGKYDLTSLKFIRPDVLFETKPQVDEGACTINSLCFSNSKEVSCQMKGGTYESGTICPVQLETSIVSLINSSYGDSCNEWYDLYTGEVVSEIKTHGESWCSNDPGVGGRYYKLSCINGDVIPESCSDYKDEVCAENTDSLTGISQAICRPNRFWTCTSCDTEECCSNADQRDCTWDVQLGCFPTADPGIKFWNKDLATQICSSGANRDVTSSVSFFQKQAVSCYSVGDCGSNINFAGDYTNQETILTKNIINQDFYESLIQKQRQSSINYDGEFFSNQFLTESEFTPTPSFEFIEVLNSYLRNIDEMLVYDVDNILDPAVAIPLHSFDVAQCEPWKPVQVNRCDECGSSSVFDGTDNYASCSEYRCNSLGPDCQFELRNGTGYCSSPYDDETPLEVTQLIPEGYAYEEEVSTLGRGIRITDTIELNQPLKLQLDTNKEALCKLSYLPDKDFTEITGSDLTNQQYAGNHDISLTFNHDFNIFDKILDYFERDTYASILDTLVDLRYKMETFKRQFPGVQKYSSGLYSILVPIVDYYLDENTQYKLEMIFNNLDDKNYFIFLKCQDLGGQETQDYYFRFILNDPCQDEVAPEIRYHEATGDGDLSIYVNEISTCSYDVVDVPYESMRFDLNCERNPYAVTGIANGTYKCSSDVSDLLMSEDSPTIFVKCQDHPEFLSLDNQFEFLIHDAVNYEILNNESGNNVSIIQTETMLFADLSVILDTQEFGSYDIYVDKSFQEKAELLFERPMQCSEDGVDLSCSSTRCILPVDKDMSAGLTVSCKEKIPQCEVYNTNFNENSYEITYEKRASLKISSTSFTNNLFIVTYSDSEDAQTDCGIQLEKRDGYYSMKKTPNSDQFTFPRTDDRVGAFVADIICLNKYGDVGKAKITYQ